MTKTFLPLRDIVEPVGSGEMDRILRDLTSITQGNRSFLSSWESCHGEPEAFFGTLQELGSREAYIDFRDRLRSHIRILSARQKVLALAMRCPGGDSSAQSLHARGAWIVTELIEIRRAGKVWSSARAKAHTAVAA